MQMLLQTKVCNPRPPSNLSVIRECKQECSTMHDRPTLYNGYSSTARDTYSRRQYWTTQNVAHMPLRCKTGGKGVPYTNTLELLVLVGGEPGLPQALGILPLVGYRIIACVSGWPSWCPWLRR